MLACCHWKIEQSRILARSELAAVLADLTHRARRSLNSRLNLVIVRLACCCGLRVSEIAGLRVGDVRVANGWPHIRVPKRLGKGGRSREVPLWWDAGTLAEIAAWKALRLEQGGSSDHLFVCSMQRRSRGKALSRQGLRFRFRTACRVLGAERQRCLTIHHGRHTFVSHALAGGRTLAEVRDAAGHTNVSITSAYLHVAVEDDTALGNLFHFADAAQ
jgi:integrase/recombinase XerD